MLKQGVFNDKHGTTHWVYVVEEPKFYRIDIVREGSVFMTDISGVEYSMFRKRKTLEYGDRELYDEYQSLVSTACTLKADTETQSGWEDGAYIVTSTKSREDLGFMYTSTLKNGVLYEETIVSGQSSISIGVVDDIYGVNLEPLNISSYTEVFIPTSISDSTSTVYYSIDELKRRYDISHIDLKDCVVADTLEVARERLARWRESESDIKGFDTETTGLDINLYGSDKLVGIILAEDEDTSTYYPFRHEYLDNLPLEFLDELMQVVISQQDRLVAQNKGFDREVMLVEGYDLRIKYCTLRLAMILNPSVIADHSLKGMIFELNGKTYLELSNIFLPGVPIDFSVLPKEIVKYYACPDGYNVITLWKSLWKKLPTFQRALVEMECQLADLIADQEFYGMRVNVKKYEANYRNCNYIVDTLLKAFQTLTHVYGNINSTAVLSNLMYNVMKCKVLLRTKTGKPSTSAAAIKKLAAIQRSGDDNFNISDIKDLFGNVIIKGSTLAKAKYPALVILDKYRMYNKLKTAFYSRFERTMKTGRVFFWVNQNGAESGRQSSPMHQLPPEMKDLMLSDADDRDLWGPDYSQIELRMIAYLAGEPELIEMCKDPDNDIHRIIGALISNKEMWEITNSMRSVGKRRNFGVVYDISKFGLAAQMYGPGYTTEQSDFCQSQIDDFFIRFKHIRRFMSDNKEFVQRHGYMSTRWLNRRRYFKEIFDPSISSRLKASLVRQANNLPVQGTAADYLKLALVNMYEYTRKKGWYEKIGEFSKVRIMLSIHDEILISAHESIPKEEIIEMIRDSMELPVQDAPPFFVSPARMLDWGGHNDDSLPIPVKYRDKLIDDYHKTGVSVFKESTYRIKLTPEQVDLFSKSVNVKNTVNEYIDKIEWEYLSGDYTTEISEEGRYEGFQVYLESGNTIYKDSNYRYLMNSYRESELRNYMDDLIKKYGTNPDVVGNKVRHPTLTHSLLAQYSEELKHVQDLDLSHEEQIVYATKCYIEGIKTVTIEEHDEDEKDIAEEYDLTALCHFDKDGNLIVEEDDVLLLEDEEEYSDDYMSATPVSDGVIHRVMELGDRISIDVNNVDAPLVDDIIREVWKSKDDNGFYKVNLIYGGQLIDAKFRVENIDIDALNEFVLRKEAEVYIG